MLSPDFKGKPCAGTIQALGSTYQGVCLSDCLAIEAKDLLSRDGCASNEICTPCINPLTQEPTGAPGCT
jgi:hypothetical protein